MYFLKLYYPEIVQECCHVDSDLCTIKGHNLSDRHRPKFIIQLDIFFKCKYVFIGLIIHDNLWCMCMV